MHQQNTISIFTTSAMNKILQTLLLITALCFSFSESWGQVYNFDHLDNIWCGKSASGAVGRCSESGGHITDPNGWVRMTIIETSSGNVKAVFSKPSASVSNYFGCEMRIRVSISQDGGATNSVVADKTTTNIKNCNVSTVELDIPASSLPSTTSDSYILVASVDNNPTNNGTNCSGDLCSDPPYTLNGEIALSAVRITKNSTPPTGLPVATGFVVTPGDGFVTFSWDDMDIPNDGTTTGYRIIRDGVRKLVTLSNSETDSDVVNGVEYCYQLEYVTAGMTSPLTPQKCVTPNADGGGGGAAPSTPTGLSASSGNNGYVNLSWNSASGAEEYEIYRNGILIRTQSGISHQDNNLTNGNQYCYNVKAVNVYGESGFSSEKCATPKAPCTIVARITNLQSSYKDTDSPITLTGTPSGGIFKVNRATSSTFNPSSLGAGNHQVTYTVNQNGCTDTDTESVRIDEGPKYTITFPSGGETLTAGSTHTITWGSDASVLLEQVRVTLLIGSQRIPVESTDGGVGNYPNTGSIDWIVPTGLDASNAKIEVARGFVAGGEVKTNSFNIRKPEAGITVIVHGFAGSGSRPIWTDVMAKAIKDRLGGKADIFLHDSKTGFWKASDSETISIKSDREVILVYDWAKESNNLLARISKGWSEAAGDNLFASLVNPTFVFTNGDNPKSFNFSEFLQQKPLHTIAHSRGNIVVLEAARRFYRNYNEYTIEHFTGLDPHPAFADGINTDFDLDVINPGSNNPKLKIPHNIKWAEVFYRNDVNIDNTIGPFYPSYEADFDFDGIPGIYNIDKNYRLDEDVLSDGGYGVILPLAGGEHSDVHLWYYGTINTSIDARNGEKDVPDKWYKSDAKNMGPRNLVGYNQSRIGQGATPNSTGIKTVISNAVVSTPFNGDFDYASTSSDVAAGWSYHGGSTGSADFEEEDGNKHLELNSIGGFTYEESNYLYIPFLDGNKKTINALEIDLQFNKKTSVTIDYKFGDVEVSLVSKTESYSFGTYNIDKSERGKHIIKSYRIPYDLLGKSMKVRLAYSDGVRSVIDIDNIKFINRIEIANQQEPNTLANFSSSPLYGGKLYKKLSNGLLDGAGRTDSYNHVLSNFSQELSPTDTMLAVAEGYLPLSFQLSDAEVNGNNKMNIPMLKDSSVTEQNISLPRVEFKNVAGVISRTQTVNVFADAENNTNGLDVWIEGDSSSIRHYNKSQKDFQVSPLQYGLNTIFVRFNGVSDTLVILKNLFYYPAGDNSGNFYSTQISLTDNSGIGSLLYVDGEFAKKITGIANIDVTAGNHTLLFHKQGYKDAVYEIDEANNSVALQMEEKNYLPSTVSKNLSFNKDTILYWNGMTTKNANGQTSELSLKRYNATSNAEGIIPLSEFFSYSAVNPADTLTFHTKIILDEKRLESTDSAYLLTVRNGTEYIKRGLNGLIGKSYDQEYQVLDYPNLKLTESEKIVFAKRQAPTARSVRNLQLTRGVPQRIAVASLFQDPDNIPNDITVFVTPNENLQINFLGRDSIEFTAISCEAISFVLPVEGIHDGLSTNTQVNISIVQPTPILTKTDISCFGEQDGSIAVTEMNGGIAPYRYEWSHNGNTASEVFNLTAGNYSVFVTDSLGCTDTASVNIVEPDSLYIAGKVTPTRCQGTADGKINAIPVGGTAPYTFLWNTGDTTEDLTALSSGVYSLTATDSRGCVAFYTVLVPEPDELRIVSNVKHSTCEGANNGSISINIFGGTKGYSVEWNTGETTQEISGLVANFVEPYEVLVIDTNGCYVSDTFEIEEPNGSPLLNYPEDLYCNNGVDPAPILQNVQNGFFVEQSGNLKIDSVSGTIDLSASESGTYTITYRTDMGMCDRTDEITIPNESPEFAYSKEKYRRSEIVAIANLVGTPNGKYTSGTCAVDSITGNVDLNNNPVGFHEITYFTPICEIPETHRIGIYNNAQILKSDTSICLSESVSFSAKADAGFYRWYINGVLRGTGIDFDFEFQEAGEIEVLVTASVEGMNVDSDTITISVIEEKSIFTYNTEKVRRGDLALEATVSHTLGGEFSAPDPDLGLNEQTGLVDLVNTKAGKSYDVIYTTPMCQIQSTESVEVFENAEIIGGQIADTSICQGLTLSFVAKENAGNEKWYQNGELAGTGENVTLDFLNVGDIEIVVASEVPGLDIDYDTVVITVTPAESPAFEYAKVAFCSSDQIMPTISGTSGGFFTSLNSDLIFDAVSGEVDGRNTPAGDYEITYTTSVCLEQETRSFSILPTPSIDIASIDPVCFGEESELTITYSGSSFPYSFEYSDAKGAHKIDSLYEPTHQFTITHSTSTEVKLTRLTYLENCYGEFAENSEFLEIYPLPVVTSDLIEVEPACGTLGGFIRIDDLGIEQGFSPITFSLNDSAYQEEPVFGDIPEGVYQLKIKDDEACIYEYPQLIEIERVQCPFTGAPNIITPNGDGLNDFWEVDLLKKYPTCHVVIFNKQGQRVFETTSGYQTPWDGTNQGKELPFGAYFYVLDLRDGTPPFTGAINLIK
jgi:gliding motility-associated-like protein